MCLSSFAIFSLSISVSLIPSPSLTRSIGCGLRTRQKIEDWDETNWKINTVDCAVPKTLSIRFGASTNQVFLEYTIVCTVKPLLHECLALISMVSVQTSPLYSAFRTSQIHGTGLQSMFISWWSVSWLRISHRLIETEATTTIARASQRTLSWANYFCQIHFIITLPFMPMSQKLSLSFSFAEQSGMYIYNPLYRHRGSVQAVRPIEGVEV